MKMKIPLSEPTNIISNHESPEYLNSDNLSQDNIDNGHHQMENESPPPEDDFAEYLWMEHVEEFDKQILQQLEEEALMQHCIEVMLDHEQSQYGGDDQPILTLDEDEDLVLTEKSESDISQRMSNLRVEDKDELAKQSTLNPDAAEFVPQVRSLAEETSS